MKKLLLLTLVLLGGFSAAFAVGKQLYLVGATDITGTDDWSRDGKPDLVAMTYDSETGINTKTVTVTGDSYFAIGDIAYGVTWDTFNSNNRWGYGSSDSNKNVSNTTSYQLTKNTNGNYSNYLSAGTYKISINSETMVMSILKTTSVSFTIKNLDPTTWSSIYLYTYGDTYGYTLGTWSGLQIYDGTDVNPNNDPRVTVTKNDNTFTVQMWVNFDNLIINKGDGTGQVEDTSFESGKTYLVGSYPSTTPSSYKTIYYVHDADWTNIHLYGFYNNGVTNISAQTGWTGYKIVENDVAQAVSNNLIKVTKVGVNSDDKSIYKVEIGDDRGYEKIIFNDGVNNSGNQTSDITPAEGKYYSHTGSEVASPAYKIAPAKTYTTYVTPDKMNFTSIEGLKAYKATSASGSAVTLDEVGAVLSGTPLVLKKTSEDASYTVPVAASASAIDNLLRAGDGTTIIGGESNYDYILSNGQFYRANEGTVAVGKAYLHLESAPSARELTIIFSDDDETDGIDAAKVNVISGTAYNLAGQKVSNDYKGIVIVNGKKVVRK